MGLIFKYLLIQGGCPLPYGLPLLSENGRRQAANAGTGSSALTVGAPFTGFVSRSTERRRYRYSPCRNARATTS